MMSKINISDMEEGEQRVIKKVLPDLVNFTLYHTNGVYQDMDFSFSDDLSHVHGFSCFDPESKTYDKLITILDIVMSCKDIKEEPI